MAKRTEDEAMEYYGVTLHEVMAYQHRHHAVSFNMACRQMSWHKHHGETNEYSDILNRYRKYLAKRHG